MRLSWAKVALGTVMAAMIVAPLTSAVAQQAPDQVRVSVDLQGADLVTATRVLMMKAGLSVVVEPSDVPFKKVTLKLENMPAEDIIRYMCESAGAYFRRDENGVYILSHNKPEPILNTAEPKAAAPKIIRKIKLMKADPEVVYKELLGLVTAFDPMAPFVTLNKFRAVVNQPFVPYYGGDKSLYDPKLSSPQNPVSQPVSSRAFANPNEVANGIELPGEAGKQFGGGGGGGLQGPGGGFGGGAGGGLGGGGGLQGGQNVTLTPGQGLVPQGITFISYDPTDNSFIVEGSDEAIQEFIKIINEFDVAPRQVTIKVEFITTSSSVSKSLGFEFLYSRGAVFAGTTPGSFIRAGDPVFLNYGTGNVTSRMRTQLLEGFGKVVNAPIIRTLNNQLAQVQSNVATTIFINQVIGNGSGSVIVSPQPQQLTISTGLIVAPRINGDGTITMTLSPTISDFGQLRRGPDGQEIPDQLSQQINVVARVKNDETIVLGGLTRKSDLGSESRVPILADLPIIGQFFRSNTRDKNNSELLIFVTPHIIEDDEGSGNP